MEGEDESKGSTGQEELLDPKVEKTRATETDARQDEIEEDGVDEDGCGDEEGEAKQETREILATLWFRLPPDMQYRVVDYLISSPDLLGVLEMLSKNGLKPHPYHYHECCKYTYLDQCLKKTLNKDAWGGSWVNMLRNRHRVRLNGFYSLLTPYWKPPNNDAFWEDRRSEFIEVKFYRHIRFMRNGKVLYMLDNNDAGSAYSILKHGHSVPKKVYEGWYVVSKDLVSIEIETHYNVINFIAQIRDADVDCTDSRRRYVGKFNILRILEHSDRPLQSPSQDTPSNTYVHKLPSNTDMCFYRHWDWD